HDGFVYTCGWDRELAAWNTEERQTPGAAAKTMTLVFRLQYRTRLGGYPNDVTVDARGARLGIALSPQRPERSKAIYDREKRGDFGQAGPMSAGLLVSAQDGEVKERFLGPAGVVSTAAISSDGEALVIGGWDRTLRLYRTGLASAIQEVKLGG